MGWGQWTPPSSGEQPAGKLFVWFLVLLAAAVCGFLALLSAAGVKI